MAGGVLDARDGEGADFAWVAEARGIIGALQEGPIAPLSPYGRDRAAEQGQRPLTRRGAPATI